MSTITLIDGCPPSHPITSTVTNEDEVQEYPVFMPGRLKKFGKKKYRFENLLVQEIGKRNIKNELQKHQLFSGRKQ